MKKFLAVAAAMLALTGGLAGCGGRLRDRDSGMAGQVQTGTQPAPAPQSGANQGSTDPAAEDNALTDVENQLKDVDSDLQDADAAPADAD